VVSLLTIAHISYGIIILTTVPPRSRFEILILAPHIISRRSFTNLERTSTVINEAGSVLPSTGGIGTTIFYIIGAILVIGAGVVLVTRRRMNVQ